MAYDGPPNFQELTLDVSYHPSGVSAADTSIRVNEDLTGYPSTGYLTWERETPAKREITKWTNVDIGTKTFTVGRGGASGDGTTARTHATTATIAVTPNKGYFDDLEAEITASFASPPAIGNVTPGAGSFTTLSATGGTVTLNTLTLSPSSGTALTLNGVASTNVVDIKITEDATTEFFRIYNTALARNSLSYVNKALEMFHVAGNATFLELTSTTGLKLGTDTTGTIVKPYIKLVSGNGTAWYFYVRNNGELRYGPTAPTGEGDGTPV